jgi:hypothetical protein
MLHDHAKPSSLVRRERPGKKLGLAAITVRRNHQALCYRVRYGGSEVLSNHVQEHVEPGGRASGRQGTWSRAFSHSANVL